MKSVAIIGAGITGLTAAFYLKRAGIPVTLYEFGDRVGGAIQSLRKDGYLAEFGPNTILETSPRIAQLIRDTGLQSRKMTPATGSETRFLVRNKMPVEMPASPLGFLSTSLFSPGAKLGVLREPFLAPRIDGQEESIAQFVIRRLGREFLDYAIDPMVAGIYAGDPDSLSVEQAFPKLAAMEANYGSLIKGSILGARSRKKSGEVTKNRAPKFSFDEGLQVLPDTLGEILGDSILLNSAVQKISQSEAGWIIETTAQGRNLTSEHRAVIYAGTAHRLPDFHVELTDRRRLDFTAFSAIRHPAVASVVLGFRREDVRHPCQGFGVLIPKVEGFRILGTIFSSSLFPNRAPADHLTLTSYVGGERHPELPFLPPEELIAMTRQDLSLLFGIRGSPTFAHCTVIPKAIPQYNLGYGSHRESMNLIETQAPHFFFAGHYRDGISLGDSIVSGCSIAERVEKLLSTDHSPC